MARLLILLCVVTTLAGCVVDHRGFLFDADTGQRSSVVFHNSLDGKRGSVEAMLADGEQCTGRFNTIPDQVTRNPDYYNVIESEDTQVGAAILTCSDSLVVKCDFSRQYAGGGSGECFDNQGREYSLNF